MASTKLNLIISSKHSVNDILSGMAHSPNRKSSAAFLANLGKVLGEDCQVDVQIGNGDGVAASGTITITNASVSANDTLVVGGATFTAKASGATGDQFNIGANATATANNFIAAFNKSANVDHTVMGAFLSGTGVAKVLAVAAGVHANHITLVATGSGFALSGAVLAGGVADSAQYISFKKGN